jgi:hypothetical protein
MKKIIKILAISMVIGGILAAVLAGTVFAAGPSGGQNRAAKAGEDAGWGNSRGLGFGPDKAVAELLGMTPEVIREQRLAGKSLVEIAATGNITEKNLIDAIMAEKTEAIQKLLAAGTITQAVAGERLEQMRERVQLAVNRTMTGPPEWAGANGKGKNKAEKGNGVGKGNGAMRQGSMKGSQAGGRGMAGGSTGNQIQEPLRTQTRTY